MPCNSPEPGNQGRIGGGGMDFESKCLSLPGRDWERIERAVGQQFVHFWIRSIGRPVMLLRSYGGSAGHCDAARRSAGIPSFTRMNGK